MGLHGIHHITAITGDAPRNVDFYARLLGLRLVKKTVNFDAPDVYHLYYADELGRPGSVLTFFEFPGAAPGRAGAGMVHTVTWRVASEAALEFWTERLAAEGVEARRNGARLNFADPEGLALELAVEETGDEPLAAEAPDIPAEHALLGFAGARAYSDRPEASATLLSEVLGFEPGGDAADGRSWRLAGDRSSAWVYDPPPTERPVQGAGSVHHIAWATRSDEDELEVRARVMEAGLRPTGLIDRQYFHSVYFREPSGVLFELATAQPGFAVDEPVERLGEELKLPPQHEPLRASLERRLTPLTNPRTAAAAR